MAAAWRSCSALTLISASESQVRTEEPLLAQDVHSTRDIIRLSEDKDYVACHKPLLYPWAISTAASLAVMLTCVSANAGQCCYV